jgi:hypothetical protein
MTMNDITLAVIGRLKADTKIAAIVSTRVYRKTLSQGTFPAITVERVSNIRDDDTNTSGYAHTRIQCTSWATTDLIADTLSELIAGCLHRTQDNTNIISIFDFGVVPDHNLKAGVFMYHRDFMIHYCY